MPISEPDSTYAVGRFGLERRKQAVPAGRKPREGVLGAQPGLDGVRQVAVTVLRGRPERLTGGHPELALDEVEPFTARHDLSVTGCSTWSRVFISRRSLARVGLAGDERTRRCPRPPSRGRGAACTGASPIAGTGRQSSRTGAGLLEHLLVAALGRRSRARRRVEYDVIVLVGEDLHLGGPAVLERTAPAAACRRPNAASGLAARGGCDGGGEPYLAAHDAHALAPAAAAAPELPRRSGCRLPCVANHPPPAAWP